MADDAEPMGPWGTAGMMNSLSSLTGPSPGAI